MNFDQDRRQDNHHDINRHYEDFNDGHEDFNEVHEDYDGTNVCKVFNYSVKLFDTRVNIWILLLVIIVILVGLFYYQHKRLPNKKDLTFSNTGGFSSTSSMNTVYRQMGGFANSPSLSSTPNFIRNL